MHPARQEALRSARRLAIATTALLALGGPALEAQEPQPAPPGPEPERELPAQLFPEEQDVQAEIIRLFHEVEKTLGEIDIELADAGAGQAPLGEGKESGIDRLLRSSREKGDQAVSNIDRILELAQQLGGGGT